MAPLSSHHSTWRRRELPGSQQDAERVIKSGMTQSKESDVKGRILFINRGTSVLDCHSTCKHAYAKAPAGIIHSGMP